MIGLTFSERDNVRAIVTSLEAERPELVAEMLKACRKCKISERDGSIKVGARTWYDPTKRHDPSSLALTKHTDGVSNCENILSAEAVAISAEHAYVTLAAPFAAEVPQRIIDTIIAEPTSDLAANWRDYATFSYVPAIMKITSLLEKHASVMMWPPAEWQNSKFPVLQQMIHIFAVVLCLQPSIVVVSMVLCSFDQKEDFEYYSPVLYLGEWIAYSKLWSPILEQWQAGKFTYARPSKLMPHAGLYEGVKWSRDAAQTKQLELIGGMAYQFVCLRFALLSCLGLGCSFCDHKHVLCERKIIVCFPFFI